MRHKSLVTVVLLYAIITLAGCGGGGGDGGGAAAQQPTTAVVRVALNTQVNNLAVLVFDLIPTAGTTFTTVRGINEASVNNFVGPLDQTNPQSTTYTLISSGGINAAANRDILEFTYAIGAGAPTPTFQIGSTVSATTTTGQDVPIVPANFVVTTQLSP
ncbi:hypothetical protein [Geobacter sp. DSM 9736]|uniref:hypothetical protein n=1 Tax=Geobacter sp. DSM 9736 TaxID=1277350 RepID=UPI000B50D8F9|nr:hypothetical protein [Geobacter sp. DSM 9736]SNB45291.1 hypothetical protein SAMN06269301_0698 [Geobacter sp. DSM 9736]